MLSKYRHLIAIAVSIGLVLSAIWIADIDDVLGTLVRFPISIVMAILGLFVLNLMVVSFRLQRLLSHFGVVISAKAVSRASISGHVSGLIMTSIFGQVIGRHVALRQFNISPMLIASITTYERMVLLLVGGSLCLTGALHLGAETALLSFLRQIPYLEMVIVVSTVLVATILLGGSRMDQRIRKSILSWRGPRSVVENVAISLAAQALVLCAFSIGALAIEPGMEVANVVAAAAIVSFAASIPLTINGWGVRELASIYTLSLIHI